MIAETRPEGPRDGSARIGAAQPGGPARSGPGGADAVSRAAGALYRFGETVMLIGILQAAWILLTLVGGVVFGIGPATVAVFTGARAAQRGEPVTLARLIRVWRSEFVPANVLITPAVLIALALGTAWLRTAGSPWHPVLLVLVTAGVTVFGLAMAMYVRYELPGWHAYRQAARFTVIQFPGALLIAVLSAGIVVLGHAVAILAVGLGVGAWVVGVSHLADRLFAANDDRLAAAAAGPSSTHVTTPTEPPEIANRHRPTMKGHS